MLSNPCLVIALCSRFVVLLHRGWAAIARPFADVQNRAWNYVTLGCGHDTAWWRQFCDKLATTATAMFSVSSTRTSPCPGRRDPRGLSVVGKPILAPAR